jgi:hypothetical protein
MAPTYTLAYNPSDVPVAFVDGRSIGGHAWGPARRGADLDRLGNAGLVVVVTGIDDESASDEARRANTQVAELNAAADKLGALSVDELRAGAAVLAPLEPSPPPPGTASPPPLEDKTDLVDRLARAGVTPADVRRAAKTATPEEA